MVRVVLSLSRNELSDTKLRALWRALDEDASGYITAGEFGRFMKKGAEKGDETSTRERLAAKRLEASVAYKAEMDGTVGRDVANRLADCQAAPDDEVNTLAEQMNAAMARLYPGQERAWVKLFKYIDTDSSGRISYNEFNVMVRDRLALSAQSLSEARLGAVWKAIDSDQSGYLVLGEFGRFMRRADLLRSKQAVEKGTEDETNRRRRVAQEERAARAREVKRNADLKHRVAARKMGDATRQLEMEAQRLEAALKRKAFRGVDMRASLPSLAGEGGEAGGAASLLGSPEARPMVRPALPPLRIGPGVDF